MYWRNWALRWLPLKTSPSITSLRCCCRDARPPFVSAILAISAIRLSVEEGDSILKICEYDSRTHQPQSLHSDALHDRSDRENDFPGASLLRFAFPRHNRLL